MLGRCRRRLTRSVFLLVKLPGLSSTPLDTSIVGVSPSRCPGFKGQLEYSCVCARSRCWGQFLQPSAARRGWAQQTRIELPKPDGVAPSRQHTRGPAGRPLGPYRSRGRRGRLPRGASRNCIRLMPAAQVVSQSGTAQQGGVRGLERRGARTRRMRQSLRGATTKNAAGQHRCPDSTALTPAAPRGGGGAPCGAC